MQFLIVFTPLLVRRCFEGNKTKFARAASTFFQCEIIPPYLLKHWPRPKPFKVTFLGLKSGHILRYLTNILWRPE